MATLFPQLSHRGAQLCCGTFLYTLHPLFGLHPLPTVHASERRPSIAKGGALGTRLAFDSTEPWKGDSQPSVSVYPRSFPEKRWLLSPFQGSTFSGVGSPRAAPSAINGRPARPDDDAPAAMLPQSATAGVRASRHRISGVTYSDTDDEATTSSPALQRACWRTSDHDELDISPTLYGSPRRFAQLPTRHSVATSVGGTLFQHHRVLGTGTGGNSGQAQAIQPCPAPSAAR